MKRVRRIITIFASLAVGATGASAFAAPTTANWQCACRVCFADGVCDYSDAFYDCTETAGGCRSDRCSFPSCPLT